LANRLPDSTGLKNEIAVHRVMRTCYDQGYRLAGAKVVEYGGPKKSGGWELEHAINKKTVAVGFVCEHAPLGGLPLEEISEISHIRGVPVIVDAAAEIPPVENLWKFSKMGVDLSVYIWGKDIRGPQSTGSIVGRKDLIGAWAFHSCPNHSIGQSMKIGKEEMMGPVTALTLYLKQDIQKELEQWEEQVAAMI
jgi:seryl-tRNA(Sec) selenium transferase